MRSAALTALALAGCLSAERGGGMEADAGDGDGDAAPGGRDASGCPTAPFGPLSDDFETAALSWAFRDDEGDGAGFNQFAVSDSRLSEAIATSTADARSWLQSEVYPGVGTRAVIEVIGVPDTSGTASGWFGVVGVGDDDLEALMRIETTILTTPAPGGQVNYDSVEHHWWQLTVLEDAIVYEASPDGVAWTLIGTQDAAPGDVQLQIGVGVVLAEEAPGAFTVDQLNLPPDRCP